MGSVPDSLKFTIRWNVLGEVFGQCKVLSGLLCAMPLIFLFCIKTFAFARFFLRYPASTAVLNEEAGLDPHSAVISHTRCLLISLLRLTCEILGQASHLRFEQAKALCQMPRRLRAVTLHLSEPTFPSRMIAAFSCNAIVGHI